MTVVAVQLLGTIKSYNNMYSDTTTTTTTTTTVVPVIVVVSSYVLPVFVPTTTRTRCRPSSLLVPITHHVRGCRTTSRTSSSRSNSNNPDSTSSTKDTTGTTTKATISSASKTNQRNTATVQQQLLHWATNQKKIQISSQLQLQMDSSKDQQEATVSSGYGWYVQNNSNSKNDKGNDDGAILLSVPSSVALIVETSSSSNDNTRKNDPTTVALPWYVQMALKLCTLDQNSKSSSTSPTSEEYRPWLQSLPRQFDTPFHWTDASLQDQLQYSYLPNSVRRQRQEWQTYYNIYVQQCQSSHNNDRDSRTKPSIISYEHFVWGCECARSRAFAGSYSGSAYNPNLYLFTLLLMTIYVGGNFGTLEQAANGAGVVFAATILNDFVLPKFSKIQRYVICPMIDMTNHNSRLAQGEVSFEYFSNSYSLSIKPNTVLKPNEQVFISYGTRSNDQLLQYYGFVEANNPHDVYVMPPIREWDISALEMACGRTFQPGRLQQLDAAGLLGSATPVNSDDMDNDNDSDSYSKRDGVVLSRSIGLDPAILQALRVLVSSDEEWNAAKQSIGNFSIERSIDNEQCARFVALTAIEMELSSKPTTIEEDVALWKQMDTMSRIMVEASAEERLALQFRIEKKRLLQETIELLKQPQ